MPKTTSIIITISSNVIRCDSLKDLILSIFFLTI